MNGTPFKLGTFAKDGGGSFAAIVLGDDVISLAAAQAAYRNAPRARALSSTASLFALLEDWDANFEVLQEIVSYIEREDTPRDTAKLADLRPLPPVARPGKMFYAAQNFQEHVDEMLRAGMTPAGGPKFTGEKSTSDPYLFLKAPSTLCGATDDIAIPTRPEEDRLGGGDRARHRQAGQAHQGRARARSRRRLHDHQRRLRPRPANPRRPAGPALRLAQRQEPRQFRADGAVPGAARLRSQRHEFVHPAHRQRRGQAERQYLAVHLHAARSRSHTPRTF